MVVQQLFQGRKRLSDSCRIVRKKRGRHLGNPNAFSSGVHANAAIAVGTSAGRRHLPGGLRAALTLCCRRWYRFGTVPGGHHVPEAFLAGSQHLQHRHLGHRHLLHHRLLFLVAVLRPRRPPNRPRQCYLDVRIRVVEQVAIQQGVLLEGRLNVKRVPIHNEPLGVHLVLIQQQPPAGLGDHPGHIRRVGHHRREANIFGLCFFR
mmetsp:Transcript_83736/g.224025  ORF Transcript_83736/g.224025 Transcript_83736/m.224025 type:complete len:205 (-) Transcript_83736:1275-1889(-)